MAEGVNGGSVFRNNLSSSVPAPGQTPGRCDIYILLKPGPGQESPAMRTQGEALPALKGPDKATEPASLQLPAQTGG